MKTNLKPAVSKARALLKKLLALAERGIDGEKTSAQRKIRRLKVRFDFSAPEPAETPDLFYKRAREKPNSYQFDAGTIKGLNRRDGTPTGGLSAIGRPLQSGAR
jgi:hypothetical protein